MSKHTIGRKVNPQLGQLVVRVKGQEEARVHFRTLRCARHAAAIMRESACYQYAYARGIS